MIPSPTHSDFGSLYEENERLKKTLATLISWMAQSSSSPISLNEAGQLLKMLEKADTNPSDTPPKGEIDE